MSVVITRELAQRCVEVVDAGLVSGVGEPVPGKMCVEAAISYALGLPHGDDPGCVSPALRSLKIRLNDLSWSSPKARARGLRRLAVAQLGSAGVLDEREFIRRVVDITIRKAVPVGLRAAARCNPKHAAGLKAAAVRCEQEGTREACRHAQYAAHAADAANAANAAANAANAATYAANAVAKAATYAASAAADAADAATFAAADAADAHTRDRVLAGYSEEVVQILITMNAPGCEFLDLVQLQEVA